MSGGSSRQVKLLKSGRKQAVPVPRGLELPGEDVIVRKEGSRLIIEPVPRRSLLALLATLEPINEDFGLIESLPVDDNDL